VTEKETMSSRGMGKGGHNLHKNVGTQGEKGAHSRGASANEGGDVTIVKRTQ